jgi:hypothetical protein
VELDAITVHDEVIHEHLHVRQGDVELRAASAILARPTDDGPPLIVNEFGWCSRRESNPEPWD